MPGLSPSIGRDDDRSDNELFDCACDLVEVTTAFRRAAAASGGARAVPAVLGCIEAAAEQLLWAAAALEQVAAEEAPRPAASSSDCRRRLERMHVGFANLQRALADAQDAARAARPLAVRALRRRPFPPAS